MATDYDLDLDNIPNSIDLVTPHVEMVHVMQEMTNLALKPMIQMNSAFAELNKSILRSISLAMPITSLFPPIKYPFAGITRTSVIDREVWEETITEVVPVPETATRTRSKLGLSVENKNIVAYKRRRLKGISSRNIEGRYLILLLLKPGLFLSDEETRAKFYIRYDQPYYWIKSKLQKRFRKIGLKINLERVWNPDGYTLISVEYLH